MSNTSQFLPNNKTLLNLSTIINAFMSSTAEAELRALYINAREIMSQHIVLEETQHPQP